jgi:hypothetical protein
MMRFKNGVCIAIATLGLAACASAETPGERFRKAISERKNYCEQQTPRAGDTTCNILKVQTAEPLGTPGGQLAHSIKLPPPWDSPKTVYRPGMGSEEYFRALCEQEAGEFVFSSVSNVEGVVQLRPRSPAHHELQQHLYAIEDPYGYRDWEAREPQFFFVGPKTYRFFEKPVSADKQTGPVTRYFGYDGRNLATMKSEEGAARARYGYIWRGISRPNDRELGIGGGELIVLDLQTGQVLGVKRGFARTGDFHISPGTWWPAAAVCPGDNKDLYVLGEFITRILKPLDR